MQIQTFINPNGLHCDVTLFGFIPRNFSRSFPGYIFWHIFCSCLLQNASDFWMKFFPTGCNFCSFLWVHQFCCINFRWRVVARDTFSLSILAYWMGYALYCIWQCFANKLFSTGCVLHMLSKIQRPAMNKLKTKMFWEKIFGNEEHEHYQYKLLPGQKHTHFLLFLFLNWNFYFLFVVTLIVETLRSHFYYTAVRWCNNYPAT